MLWRGKFSFVFEMRSRLIPVQILLESSSTVSANITAKGDAHKKEEAAPVS